MTAFARVQHQSEFGSITIELKSVNHRYLDLGFHLPDILRQFEPTLRTALQKQIQRGRIDCYVIFQPGPASTGRYRINRAVLDQLQQAFRQINGQGSPIARIDPLDLLRWPDLLSIEEKASTEVNSILLDLFEEALQELVQARQREGVQMKQLFGQLLHVTRQALQAFEQALPEGVEQRKATLRQKFEEMKLEMESIRFEQEVLYHLQRTDVTEEFTRLQTHVNEFERILSEQGSIGRRLDFLLQEMNREANTMSAKSVSHAAIRAALDLKLYFEQMREQVQNIE